MTKVSSFNIIKSNSDNGLLETTVSSMNGRFITDRIARKELRQFCKANGVKCIIEFHMGEWTEKWRFPKGERV